MKSLAVIPLLFVAPVALASGPSGPLSIEQIRCSHITLLSRSDEEWSRALFGGLGIGAAVGAGICVGIGQHAISESAASLLQETLQPPLETLSGTELRRLVLGRCAAARNDPPFIEVVGELLTERTLSYPEEK